MFMIELFVSCHIFFLCRDNSSDYHTGKKVPSASINLKTAITEAKEDIKTGSLRMIMRNELYEQN
jgi:hypothetical protein